MDLSGAFAPVGPLRVRKVLDGMHASTRAALRRLIPVADTVPELPTAKYPAALLAYFPKPNNYAALGVLAEALLKKPADAITLDTLRTTAIDVRSIFDYTDRRLTAAEFEKVAKSKTTQPFLDLCITTRKAMDTHIRGALSGESQLAGTHIVGHPDARTTDQIFEMKLTGDLKKNWSYFLCQVHAYAALDKAVNDIYLVLPLQSTVVHFDVRAWAGRAKFLANLEAAAAKLLAPPAEPARAIMPSADGADVLARYNIGSHMPKYPTLLETVLGLPTEKPSQIFVGAPQNSKLALKADDITAAKAVIESNRLQVYIHAPYIINLADDTPDDWALNLLKKNLEAGAALGCRGVVVHVGKSKGADVGAAVEKMRVNIGRALEAATVACPLLLETPAGQGTELLTQTDDFIGFVCGFADPRLRACLDTCHVFACGHDPVKYVEAITTTPDMLRLVHFNDSMDICGSCKDRHALIGTGKIGVDVLESVAAQALSLGIPMVVE